MRTAALQPVVEPGWSPAIPAHAIAQLLRKLEDGTYPTESVRCPCGADFTDDRLTQRDRFFIPHCMVLCRECALIRATPRMTAEAYAQFYNEEYRPIYDGWQFGERGAHDDFRFLAQAQHGVSFKQFLEYFNIKPRTIVDVGAHMGGMLLPFQEQGVQVHGIEINAHGVHYARRRGIPMHRSLDEAALLGVQADLIVLQDVVEHLLDLDDLAQLRRLLKPDGIVYIGTPGLFLGSLSLLWQNAHVWQFIAETLNYVMEGLGYEAVYLDETIDSLWVYHGEPPATRRKPADWTIYIQEHLSQLPTRRLPPIRCVNKFTVEEQWAKIDQNLDHGFPDIRPLLRTESGSAVIVGGGPSVDAHVEVIRQRQADGAKLLVIERMYPWCSTVGLCPEYVVALDGSEDVVEGFTAIQPGTTHILGHAVQPEAAKCLIGTKTYLYSSLNPHMKVQNLWYQHGYDKITVVNTGGSVTLACFALAPVLGFRDIHFYGFDLMVGEAEYAAGIAGRGVPRSYFPVEIDGQEVLTCITFLSFAQQFFKMAKLMKRHHLVDTITVHGESLINKMWDREGVA